MTQFFTRRANTHRKFIAAILAFSVAIAGFSAAPARADEDVAKFLAGLAVLGIIGAAINDAKDDAKRTPPRRHDVILPDGPRPKPHHVRKYDLPGGCLTSLRVNGQNHRFLAQRCLKNNYRYTRQLPQRCHSFFDNGHQRRQGYRPKCLRRHGYRLTAG